MIVGIDLSMDNCIQFADPNHAFGKTSSLDHPDIIPAKSRYNLHYFTGAFLGASCLHPLVYSVKNVYNNEVFKIV
jgi:hypothetical protein